MTPTKLVQAICVFVTFCALQSFAEDVKLLRITPSGEDVPSTREIVFEFDRTMVPLGRMDRTADEISASVSPNPGCEWRWLNVTTLACQLSEKNALKPATRYKITVHSDFRAFDGALLGREIEHVIVTERPRVTAHWFETWKSPGMPLMHVTFNQEVSESSVGEHLYFEDESGKRYDSKVEKITYDDAVQNEFRIFPENELPLESSVELVVDPGIEPSEGQENSVEQRAIVEFATFPEFRFAGIRCAGLDGKRIEHKVDSPGAEKCDPLNSFSLLFSSPVLRDAAKDGIASVPDFAGDRKDYDPWEGVYSYSNLGSPHQDGVLYELELPYPLKAAQVYSLKGDAEKITDEFGRKLPSSFEFSFETDHRRPRYHLEHDFSVLESDVDTEVPIVVTNLNGINLSFSTQTAAGFQAGRSYRLKIHPALDIAYAYPLGVRKLLGGASGVVRGSIDPFSKITPHVPIRSGAHRFFSQITPFHVHVKLGHFNSVAWVTDLASGEPVADASVSLIADQIFSPNLSAIPLTESITDKSGLAQLAGVDKIDPELKYYGQWDKNSPVLMAKVVKGSDIAMVPLSYDFRAWSNGAYSWKRKAYGHLKAWGTTDQGIYRLGDTLNYKVYVRHQDKNHFIEPPRSSYTLVIYDPLDTEVFRKEKILLSEFGAFDGSFVIPAKAAVGWYRFELAPSFTDEKWEPLRVLVSDFTPAPFKVTTELDHETYKSGDAVDFRIDAKLHAGGPYVDAPVRVTALLNPTWLSVDDQALSGFVFSSEQPQYQQQLYQQDLKLNDKGELEDGFKLTEEKVVYGNLMLEGSVRDDRGKSIAARDSAKYFGRDRYVGIRQEDWILEQGKSARYDLVVLDTDLKPVDGVKISAKVEREEIKGTRVKSAGNAYLMNYVSEWREIALCDQSSTGEPVSCEFAPDGPGEFRITATVQDSKGREHSTAISRWAAGKGWNLWESPESTELKVIAEKESVKVGEKVRLMIQNPYPGARALVTMERYGIQKSWIETFPDSSHILEVPVTADQIPGFYLSVVLMSPRVEKPLEDNGVDLGKPVFRMGYVKIDVVDQAKKIEVKVTPQAEQYRPRETVTIDISAQSSEGKSPPMEFAVTVLDQAVFDLLLGGKDLFDPYKGFYSLASLDVDNYNILKMLVGRQKFEKKGASAGGDGGGSGKVDMRSLFKFVSYWNPSIKPDKDGKAQISFPVPDNLTGWQVFVLAVTKDDLMGLGEASFKVNKPTEIRPALPNQVLEGDRVEAKFTVMNRTDTPRTVAVQGSASGLPLAEPVALSQTVELAPFKRETISFSLNTEREGMVTFDLTAKDALDSDGVQLTLPVKKAYVIHTGATFGSLDDTRDRATVPVQFPEDILTDRGGLALITSASMVPALSNAFQYMRDYPYICWEQRLTKGVAAAHYLKLKAFTDPAISWEQAAEVVKSTLDSAQAFQAPNGGMTYFIADDQHVSPYLSAYTALAFNWLRELGYIIPEQIESKLDQYLLNMLRRDVMPDFFSAGMASTVRAVALAALAQKGKVDASDLARYAIHLDQMTLFGKAHYLLAAIKLGDVAQRKAIYDKILSFSNQTGGKLGFVEKVDPSFERIHDSTLRSNCSVLSGFLKLKLRDPDLSLGELPVSLARTISQTIAAPHGQMNTQELMFCMNSLIDYQRVFEKVSPHIDFSVNLSGQVFGKGEFRAFTDKPLRFDRPMQSSDPGRTAELEVVRTGQGRLYYQAQMSYAPKALPTTTTNSGMDIWREYSVERDGKFEKISSPFKLKVGDLVRVDLFLSLPAARNFVVFDDPIPGGLEPVNRDLATASVVDAAKGDDLFSSNSIWKSYPLWYEFGSSFWSFYHKELRHDFARFYSEYLEAGQYHLSYTAQAIAPGKFTVLPAKALEMYSEDVYGMWVTEKLEVTSN